MHSAGQRDSLYVGFGLDLCEGKERNAVTEIPDQVRETVWHDERSLHLPLPLLQDLNDIIEWIGMEFYTKTFIREAQIRIDCFAKAFGIK